jgi:hypothetical protein
METFRQLADLGAEGRVPPEAPFGASGVARFLFQNGRRQDGVRVRFCGRSAHVQNLTGICEANQIDLRSGRI